MKIAVIGGGNIGTLTAAELALNHNVNLYTSVPINNQTIDVYNNDDELLYSSKIDLITDNMESAISNADIIISTVPSNAYPEIATKIANYIKNGAYLIFIPGTGGREYITKSIINKKVNIIGMQRVFSIARLKEKGKSVYMLGKKSKLFISSIPKNDNAVILIEQLFNIPTVMVDNYLAVTLTPSNPILHTARLYSMFSDKQEFEKEPLFYEEWDLNSASMLFKCDEELQLLCNKLNKLDLSEVISLKEYYESDGIEQKFVDKIHSIESFKGLKAPMIEKDGKYFPDFNSRYFIEDFPFGLFIIKGFACICDIDTPYIDKVLMWFQNIKKKEYIIDGKLKGKDVNELGIPQNYGIDTIEKIYYFYK